MKATLALTLLALAAPAGAWSPDALETDSNVPKEISAQWNAPPSPAPGQDWDKFYFQSELGDERTIWCRHKDCEQALRGGDTQRRVPLYYLSRLDPQPAGEAPGAVSWRAILSAYAIHWEPSAKGGLNEVISREGTPLAIRPSRPWKKEDPWNLQGPAVVLPPVSREVVPPYAALLVEAKDWPPCWNLDTAGPAGAPASIRRFNPMEIEIEEASNDSDARDDFHAMLKDTAGRGDAGVYARARNVRAQDWSAAERELNGKALSNRFNAFEARFLLCRAKRYDHFQTFRTEMSQTHDPAGFVAKWRQFVHGEIAEYIKEADGMPGTPGGRELKSPLDGYQNHDYQKELAAAGRRTVAALDGRAPALARGPESRPHPEEMRQAAERVNAILEQVK